MYHVSVSLSLSLSLSIYPFYLSYSSSLTLEVCVCVSVYSLCLLLIKSKPFDVPAVHASSSHFPPSLSLSSNQSSVLFVPFLVSALKTACTITPTCAVTHAFLLLVHVH